MASVIAPVVSVASDASSAIESVISGASSAVTSATAAASAGSSASAASASATTTGSSSSGQPTLVIPGLFFPSDGYSASISTINGDSTIMSIKGTNTILPDLSVTLTVGPWANPSNSMSTGTFEQQLTYPADLASAVGQEFGLGQQGSIVADIKCVLTATGTNTTFQDCTFNFDSTTTTISASQLSAVGATPTPLPITVTAGGDQIANKAAGNATGSNVSKTASAGASSTSGQGAAATNVVMGNLSLLGLLAAFLMR